MAFFFMPPPPIDLYNNNQGELVTAHLSDQTPGYLPYMRDEILPGENRDYNKPL